MVWVTRNRVGSWNRRACPVLCHISLCYVWKELPLQLDVWGCSCERAHDPTDTYIFFVCVLFSILINQSTFWPHFVCAASQTPSLSSSTVLSTTGAPIHTEKKTWAFQHEPKSNQSWPHTAQSQHGAGARDGYKAPSEWKLLLLLFVVLHLVEQQVIPLYKHVQFWAPSQALKQWQLWLVRWDKINWSRIWSSNHYWKKSFLGATAN